MIIAPKPPKETSRMASFPLPWSKRWCPGIMDRTVPSSGTPRNMDGTNSSKAWDMDMERRKTASTSGEYEYSRKGDAEKTNAPTVFT